ncbi:MAG: restriction endonuclease subunit S [Candidatus Freyarchaeota archaeon]
MVKMFLQSSFKQTPIGPLPLEWKVVKLGEAAEIRGNKTISGISSVAFIPMGLVPDQGIFAGYEIRGLGEVKSVTYCEAGDLLLAKITPSLENNKQGIVPDDIPNGFAFATTEVYPIVCKDIDKLFLFYILKFPKFRKVLEFSMRGTTGRQRVPREAVEKLRIPLPPLPEQRKIAEVLSTVDRAIGLVDEAIRRTERLKRGLMRELLTRGIGHEEFRFSRELGCEIPREWEVVRLGDTLELCQYGLSVPLKKEGKYPIVRMDEIVNGYVIPKITKYVDLKEETFRLFKLEKGDILFNRTNAPGLVGRTGIFLLDGDYVFASYLIRLRPKDNMFDPRFLTFYLVFSHDRLKQLATRAIHQANINATNLKRVKIPRPPLLEQQKIAEILSTVDKKLELERNRRKKLERIKRGLMNDLLTGRRRVRI